MLVVGRSGSGKSTLLMLTGGWIEPDSGTVEPSSTRWADLAYVPQRFGLVPELTVAENIELPARHAGAAPSMPDLLERLAIDELRNRTPGEISIGQQQRVAIARALRLASPILLVDEPTSHQDAAHAELVWAALGEAATTGTACLVATHELDAHNRADRWWQIDDWAPASRVRRTFLLDTPLRRWSASWARLAVLVVELQCRGGSQTSAKQAGVSEATVSRVLNGKPGISDTTRAAC